MRFLPAASVLLPLALAASVFAQERPLALTGARIYPIAGEPIADGVLVLQGGKIVAVGAAGAVTVPAGAEVRALPPGKVILPGLVDSHSHIGGAQGGDGSGALHPEVRVLDALDARHASIQRAQAGAARRHRGRRALDAQRDHAGARRAHHVDGRTRGDRRRQQRRA